MPTVMLIAPPLPPVAAPEPIDTDPVVPELEDPELNTNMPLVPSSPAFADLIVTAPLVTARLCPLLNARAPPVEAVLSPDATVRRPPAPLVPAPTVTLSAPPLPPDAIPDPMDMLPDPPELAVPELKTSTPLEPVAPPFADRITTLPLDVAMPCPLIMLTEPPVSTWLSEDVSVRYPPAPLVPMPTVTLNTPPLPPVVLPDPMEMLPDPPELDEPELKTSTPLVPLAPAFADRITMLPLVLVIPCPLVTPIAPPVDTVL
jgi:hypothetical protein